MFDVTEEPVERIAPVLKPLLPELTETTALFSQVPPVYVLSAVSAITKVPGPVKAIAPVPVIPLPDVVVFPASVVYESEGVKIAGGRGKEIDGIRVEGRFVTVKVTVPVVL